MKRQWATRDYIGLTILFVVLGVFTVGGSAPIIGILLLIAGAFTGVVAAVRLGTGTERD